MESDLDKERKPAFTVLEAPSSLGLSSRGVEEAPQALLRAGLARRLSASLARRVEPLPGEATRDPATGVVASGAIAAYAVALADALGPLTAPTFPIVLGGDCSIMLGSLLALRRRGRFGLLFLDGHTDFYTPETEPVGEAASMELALATGHGPAALTDMEGRCPLVRPEDVVALGARDAWGDPHYVAPALPESLYRLDLEALRRLGPELAARRALAHLDRPELEGFWIHLDVDVVDDRRMPAVDYRMPGGLSWDELGAILRAAFTSGRAMGLEIAIYNPTLDPEGQAARDLVACLVEAIAPTTRAS